MEPSDDELVDQCRAGDAEAFGVLVRRYAGRANQIALGLVGDHADATDISQEAFVRAWRHIRLPYFVGESMVPLLCSRSLPRKARHDIYLVFHHLLIASTGSVEELRSEDGTC